MTLVQKYALLPDEIDEQSLRMVEASLPDSLDLTPDERFVVCRIVRAEGDPQIAESIRISPGAVERGDYPGQLCTQGQVVAAFFSLDKVRFFIYKAFLY